MSSRLVNWGISITGGSTIIINSTQPSTFTNITAASIVGTDISTGTINASTGITSSSLLVTNLVSTNTSLGNLTSLTGTFANKVGTNQTVGTINVTTGITSSALLITGLASVSNLFSTNGSITNLILISGSIGSLSTGNISVSGNMTVGGNLLVQGSLISVNITSVNVVDTNITAGTLNATLASIGNLITTNISSGTIRASTNVAIGSNTAAYTLDVTGNARFTTGVEISGGSLSVTRIGSTTNAVTYYQNNNGNLYVGVDGFGLTGDNGQAIMYTSSLPISFYTGATQRMIVGSSGNIGIGLSAPTVKLDIVGASGNTIIRAANPSMTTGVNDIIYFGRDNSNNNMGILDFNYISTGSGSNSIGLGFFGGNNKLVVNGNGQIGINTSNPESALHVTGTRAGAPTTKGIHMGEGGTNDYAIEICAANATSNAYIDFTSPSNDFKGRILYNLSSNVMQFFTNTTNYMTLGSTGNLDITGNVSISGTQLSMANGTNNTIVFTTSGFSTPTLSTNGGVGCKLSLYPGGSTVPYGIGVEGSHVWYASGGGGHKWYNTTTTASMQLTGSNLIVTGDITAFGSISDINLKTNITPVSLGLTTTLALNPVTFNWKDNIFNVEKRGLSDVGFIAQEVEQLIPQAVGQFTTPDGEHVYKNLKHERILPYTVSAIQELNAKIEKQQTVIDSLLERLAIIEAL